MFGVSLGEFLIYVVIIGLVLWLFGRLLRLLVRGRR